VAEAATFAAMAWLDGRAPDGSLIPAPAAPGVEVSAGHVLGVAQARGEQFWVAAWDYEHHVGKWESEGPSAVLFDLYTGEYVGDHGGGPAGGGPTWTAAADASVVQASLPPGLHPDNPPDRIPNLLLYTTSASSGLMGRVRAIQRIETSGGHPGHPPTQGQAEAVERRTVPYTALYVFHGDLPEQHAGH